jgi:peptide/nickel transport system permease protein
MRIALILLRKFGRCVVLLFLAAMGTVMLMRLAPGYFDDAREMDVKYARGARSEIGAEEGAQGSIGSSTVHIVSGFLHGNLGESRQYEIPVSDLIRPRLRVTTLLLARGVAYGWLLALCAALPLSTLHKGSTLFGAPFTILLAVPTGAMATFCLLSGGGGPVLVLTLVLAARDFKFVHQLLRSAWKAPHLLQARAGGTSPNRLILRHVMPNILPNLLALATLSLVTALSAIVPIEVIFDVPGVGQLAWAAAMNRDLPVLLAVTLLMATAVTLSGLVSNPAPSPGTA